MITFPNCKINLGLHVVRRREDGYHDLESLFLPVEPQPWAESAPSAAPRLCDRLEINPADTFSFTQDGIAIDGNSESNLVVKAYRLMQQTFGDKIQPCSIALTKNIPFGAGLGGGSSDAAFTLRMLNDLFALNLDNETLKQLSVRLGADCPFFIDNRPAYVTGIGDRMEPFGNNPISPFRLVLVKPDTAVSTAEAYRGIVPRNRRNATDICDLRQAVTESIENWHQTIVNDFEATVFASHPELASIKQQLYDAGALYVSMSGSGSALFALFPKDIAHELNDELKRITILID